MRDYLAATLSASSAALRMVRSAADNADAAAADFCRRWVLKVREMAAAFAAHAGGRTVSSDNHPNLP